MSCSALASHWRTTSLFTSSGGLIDYFPVFVRRISDAAMTPLLSSNHSVEITMTSNG
jgi:hypothetical protein